MVAEQLRRLAEAVRAGEFSGDMADALDALAADADAERAAQRTAQRDMLANAALREQRDGRDAAACVYMAAAHMVS